MSIYVINMLLILFWDAVLLQSKKSKQTQKLYIIIISIQFILISSLRAYSIGADTLNYENNFWEQHNLTWNEMFRRFVAMFTDPGNDAGRDVGYYMLVKAFEHIIPSFRTFLFFVITVFMAALGRFIYKYSDNYCMSYMLFAGFLFQFYGLTGIRQTFATVLVVFVAFECIRKRKLVLFLVVVFIAMTIHKSALIVLPFYFIYKVKPTQMYKALVAIASVGLLLAKSVVESVFAQGVYDRYFGTGGITSYNFLLMLAAIVFIALLFSKQICQNSEIGVSIIHGTVIAFLFIECSLYLSIMMRVGYYYIFYLLILLPEILKVFDKKSRYIINMLLYVLLIVLFIRTGTPYLFFWQE